jgi:heavy metal sensor kinase
MFFAKISSLRRTIAFRLTLTYAAIFAASSVAFFIVLYAMLLRQVNSRMDDDLQSDCNESTGVLASQGTKAVQEEFDRDAAGEGVNDMFVLLLDSQGHSLASSNLSSWHHFLSSEMRFPEPSSPLPSFRTFAISGRRRYARVMQVTVDTDKVLQIGRSLRQDELLLRGFERVSALTIAVVMALATMVGWFLARRALGGVEEVTQTAIAIAHGSFDRRVPLRGSNDEIDRLAATFNDMLQRIQTLIDEMKEITDNVAHDLRSPIARMRGVAEMTLIHQASPEDFEAVAANTVEECDRLLGMINTMLAISEAETGMGKLDLSDFDMAETVRDVCELFSPVAEEKGVVLHLADSGAVPVRGDLQKIQRALSDLVDNAVKYTPRGGEVEVAASVQGGRANVTVRDTGAGIFASDLPRIFERFYRGDHSRSQPGSGLGLSLARALLRAHEGDITVNSVPGEGTTFRIDVPRASYRWAVSSEQ